MTMNTKQAAANSERVVRVQNGWLMLPVVFGLLLASLGLLVFSIENGTRTTGQPHAGLVAASLLLLAICFILRKGFFTLQPNEARVLVLFGNYEAVLYLRQAPSDLLATRAAAIAAYLELPLEIRDVRMGALESRLAALVEA